MHTFLFQFFQKKKNQLQKIAKTLTKGETRIEAEVIHTVGGGERRRRRQVDGRSGGGGDEAAESKNALWNAFCPI